ncbi:MAG: hypothetical protein ACRD0K_28790 [Egibacteraceae bacterium]
MTMGDPHWIGEPGSSIEDDALDGASDALVCRLAALAYADKELTALLLGTLGPGSRHYLQRSGHLAPDLDVAGRPQLTDRGHDLCKQAAGRVVDQNLGERAAQARSALSEAIIRAERMAQASGSSLKF